MKCELAELSATVGMPSVRIENHDLDSSLCYVAIGAAPFVTTFKIATAFYPDAIMSPRRVIVSLTFPKELKTTAELGS